MGRVRGSEACVNMADEPQPSTSGVKRKRVPKQHKDYYSASEIAQIILEGSDSDQESNYSSDDSLDGEGEESVVRTGDVDIGAILRSEAQREERAELESEYEASSDTMDTGGESPVSGSAEEGEGGAAAAIFSQPRGASRGRGRVRTQGGVRARSRGRGRILSTGGRGRGRGIRNFDETSLVAPNHQQPEVPLFTGQPGLKEDVDGDLPADYYRLFLTNDFTDYLATETNRYAAQTLAAARERGPISPHSRLRGWVPVDRTAMQHFIGLQLLTGLVQKPSIASYWSKLPILQTPIFASVMPRNRFQEILRFWHANNNEEEPPRDSPDRDRLYKLRPVITHLQDRFQNVYTPEKEIAIDESLLLWKGQLLFKQYIPLKRARFGIKLFNVCERSGYTYRFHIYTGKEDPAFQMERDIPPDAGHLSMTEKIVVYMAQPLLGKGYQLYMDNWYSGVSLYLYLKSKNTVSCGTVKENRCPVTIRQLQLEEGE